MDENTETNPVPPARPFVAPHDPNDLSGTTLGGYKLVRKLAQGGMGVIYEAIQVNLDRKVALKILTGQLAARPEFLQRFEREAKAAASFNHPNIVQVHDFGEADGRRYIIMEFVEGENLSTYVEKRGKIPIENALAIIEQAALALKAVSGKSIIHRDIKPSNLMITREGRIKVADLGLAEILTEDSELTMSSAGIGSPHFIAPEQVANAKNADHRVDIYSLGVTLLFLVTGKYAYDGDSPISIVLAHATKPLPSGAELGTELPPQIEALISRMAAKNPDERYQDYDELLTDLQLVSQGCLPMASAQAEVVREKLKRNKVIAAICVGAIVLLVAIEGIFLRFSKKPSPPVPPVAAASIPAPVPSVAAAPMAPARPTQRPDAISEQMPPDEGNMRDDTAGRPRFPLPMGPPPRLPAGEMIPDGPVAAMLAAANDYAQKNPGNFREILGRYRTIQQRAVGTPDEREVGRKLRQWSAAQNRAAAVAVKQYEAKMRTALSTKGPQAAYDVWKDFPSNLRSRETDGQIVRLLQKTLPPDFAPNGPAPMRP